jgi:hypothetical protein
MGLTSTASEPTVSGLGGSGSVPTFNNIIFSYPMAASASVSQGDFVKLASSTAGTISKCSATSDTMIGIANVSIDNSSGSAGDKYCPVIVAGVATVDGLVTASGTYDEPIRFRDAMYLCGSATAAGDIAQKLTSTTAATVGTTKVARALDAVSTPTTSATYRIRVYVNFLDKALA